MAQELKVGERKVYTTPSSLASRMGVVKGQTGDPFQIAANNFGKSLDILAAQQAKIAEEKWKADFQINGYKTLSKYAFDHKLDLAGFVNKTDDYINTSVNAAPKKYQSWAKQYLGMMAAQEANSIKGNVLAKDQVTAINLNKENEDIVMGKIEDIVMQVKASDLTGNPHLDIIQVYENKIFPQVSELLASYENLKGGLSADLVDSGHMSLSLEEKQYQILKQIEEFRNKSIAKEWLDLAINDMAKGKGLGYESEIDEYDVQSLMDTTVAHLNSEIQKFEDGESRGEIDKAMFTDLRPEDRQEIANNVRNFVNEYSERFKSADLSQTQVQKAQQEIFFSDAISGKANVPERPTVNDTSNLITNISEIINFGHANGWEFDDDKIQTLVNEFTFAKTVKNIGDTVLSRKVEGEVIPGKTSFETAVGMIKKAHPDITDTKIRSMLTKHIFQETSRSFTSDGSVIYSENMNMMLQELPAGGYVGNAAIETAKHVSWVHNVTDPALLSFFNSAKNLNMEIPENITALKNLSDVYAYTFQRKGQAPEGVGGDLHLALLEFDTNVQFGFFDMNEAAKIFTARVNKGAGDLDEKIALIEQIMYLPNEEINWYDIKRGDAGLQGMTSGNPNWLRDHLKNWLGAMNPELKKKWEILGFKHEVIDIPFLGEFGEFFETEWDEGDLDAMLDEVLANGFEEALKKKMAMFFNSESEIQRSKADSHFLSIPIKELADSNLEIGSNFDFVVWQVSLDMMRDSKKWGLY